MNDLLNLLQHDDALRQTPHQNLIVAHQQQTEIPVVGDLHQQIEASDGRGAGSGRDQAHLGEVPQYVFFRSSGNGC